MEQTAYNCSEYSEQSYRPYMVREEDVNERISKIGSGRMKDYDELDFTDDFLFCKILEDNPDLCEELVGLILGQEIHLVNIHKQETVKLTQDGKGVRMDVFAGDDKDQIFDIEMQTTHKKNIARRSRYYQGIIDMNQLGVGSDYDQLSDSYIIFICTFDPIGNDLPKYTFRNICMEDHNIVLDEGTAKVFLNTESSKIEMSLELAALFEYIKNREATDQLTRKIDDLVRQARDKEQWRKEYMWHRDAYEADLKKEVYGVGHKDGVEEGIEIGREEGRAEGLEKGQAKGRAEGEALTLVANVEKLAENTSCSIAEACELLCISMEEYEKAKQHVSG